MARFRSFEADESILEQDAMGPDDRSQTTSFLKDVVELPGRGVAMGVRVAF